MSLVDRIEETKRNHNELSFLVRILRKTYGYDDKKLGESIKKALLLGDNELEKQREHPEKVLEIILPLILSYEKVDDKFAEAIEALKMEGIREFYTKLGRVSF